MNRGVTPTEADHRTVRATVFGKVADVEFKRLDWVSQIRFLERYREPVTWAQLKVLRAIERCRTAAPGGHRDQCERCGYQTISYNSCRNRHCPKCQTNAREKWLRARKQELLPVGYFHSVFSVPRVLVPLMWQNKRVLFSLLFEASAARLLEVAAENDTALLCVLLPVTSAHVTGET